MVPTLYAVAMALDGVFALFIGKVYDKKGIEYYILFQ